LAFENLREQLKDKLEELKVQLEGSPSFNTLKERYETLSPTTQKTVLWSSIIFVSFMMFSCPMSYWSESVDNISQYEETRDMIRDLLRSSHLVNQMGSGPEQIPLENLKSLIQSRLGETRLVPEQIASIESIDTTTLGPALAPSGIIQETLQVSLKKLNLRQVVDLGYKMQEIHGTVKLAGLDIVATAENDHYFDVLFKLVKFSLPGPPPSAVPNEEPKTSDKTEEQEEANE